MMNSKEIFSKTGEKWGEFLPECAGFQINSLNLPAQWDYIYQNRDILLKVDQFGPVYAQAEPPGDIMLFKRENGQRFSNWSVWLSSKQIDDGLPFNNFFRPVIDGRNPSKQPENLKIVYRPECATYEFRHEGLQVFTEFSVPLHGTEIVMKLKVRNTKNEQIELEAFPFLVPYVNQAQVAPWDKYEWYLKTGLGKEDQTVFWSQLMDSSSDATKRRTAVLWTNREDMAGAEISLEKFIGNGSLEYPESVCTGEYRIKQGISEKFGQYTDDNVLYGYPPVYAPKYAFILGPDEEKEITQVLCLPKNNAEGWLPDTATASASTKYFDPVIYEKNKEQVKQYFAKIFSRNTIHTGDEFFDYYVNYWIPLQMAWVASLDRGWPTGMRGTRDSAQDYAGLLITGKYESCKEILLTMLSCQRSDGWFPRQYSAKGRKGRHDLRGHVDGGAFTIEYLWLYLAHTGDYDILQEVLPWLDSDVESPVFVHMVQAMEYYIEQGNLGEHGLCKIREGDWLDAVNRAGIQGRGESVLVTEQTVMNLKYMADIFAKAKQYEEKIEGYLTLAEEFKQKILDAALNKSGFFNGTYTDNGEWIFSDCDPDGEERPYGPVNWYAIIAGIVVGKETNIILEVAQKLKGDCGYRLYHPPMGHQPISCVGRAGSGDSPAYLGENGNVYNHGSQGFLARAMSVARDGEKLMDCLKWMMPYDQSKHPTMTAMSAPYAIVNCWQELPIFRGRVMMTFLTGSVAMAERGVYEWMLGIKPTLDGLVLDPCLPSEIKKVSASFECRGKKIALEIEKTQAGNDDVKLMFINNMEATGETVDIINGRKTFCIPYEDLKEQNKILVVC